MRIFILLSLFLSSTCLGISPEQLVKLNPLTIEKYSPRGLTDSSADLPVHFDESKLGALNRIAILKSRSIKRITLYYTVYQRSQLFSQPELNLERFKNLWLHFPEIFSQSYIEWRVIGQTAPGNAEEAKKLFHGFVFEFMPAPTALSIKAEAIHIEKILKDKAIGHDSIFFVDREVTKAVKKWTGFYHPKMKWRKDRGKLCSSPGVWHRKKQIVTEYETVMVKRQGRYFVPGSKPFSYLYKQVRDSSVCTVLSRNEHWNNMVFVVDVTGSMSPYLSQLYVWYKLNSSKRHVKNFTFFNDGNKTEDNKKKIGATGGVYFSAAKEADDVMKESNAIMTRGSGGDAPENNCEAILTAIQKNPDATEIFMIADNYANMRDVALISQITKPVHIILCGVQNNYFNTQYLDLARQTGGSVHTLDQDITNLMNYSEGQKVKFGDKVYRIRNGKFELNE